MRDFYITFRFLLKNYFSFQYFRYRIKHDRHLNITFVILMIAFLTLIPFYIFLLKGLVNLFHLINNLSLGTDATLNQGSLFIAIGVFLSFLVSFLFSSYHIIAHFYFSNDLALLIPKPLKIQHLLLSKLAIIYLYYLIMNAFIVLPFFIVYGVYSSLKIYHWVFLIIGFLLLPIIPISLSTLLTVLLMRYTALFHRKNLLRFIGMLLMILMIFSLQFAINQFVAQLLQDSERLETILQDHFYIVQAVGKFYPVLLFVFNGIHAPFLEAFGNILLFIVTVFFMTYLVVKLLQEWYLSTFFEEQQTVSSKIKQKRLKNRLPVYRSIARIDFHTMLREPVFLLNCLGITILVPLLLFVLPIVFQGNEFIIFLRTLHTSFRYHFWIFITFLFALFGSLSPIAVTSFSREGKRNWIMRTLPIPAKDHILGRAFVPLIAQFLFAFLTVAILIGILQTGIWEGVVALLQTAISGVPFVFIGLLIDLYNPQLKWENPQRAVKQNLNVVVMMGIGSGYVALCGLGYYALYATLNLLSPLVRFLLFNAIFLILNVLLSFVFYRILYRRFEERLVVMPS